MKTKMHPEQVIHSLLESFVQGQWTINSDFDLASWIL